MVPARPRLACRWKAPRFLAVLGALMLAIAAQAGAAELGHARIVSMSGQPLKIDVPLVNLDAVEQSSLKVRLAASAAWSQAGLTPPVSLDNLRVRVTYARRDNARMIEVSSDQPFDGTVADLLLNIGSAEGERQYQVSILADMPMARRPVLAPGTRAAGVAKGVEGAAHGGTIHVRRGDTMFAIAHRNAVPGVTVYQMMIALQRANPRAFIDGNVNLVKAGARLAVPDKAAMTAISDREARRLFVRQLAAFEAYRQRLAGGAMPAARGASASSGRVSAATPAPAPAAGTSQDRLILSSGASAADQKVATGKAVADAKQRITQLEKNVHRLDEALHGGPAGATGSAGAAGAAGAVGGQPGAASGAAASSGSGTSASSGAGPSTGKGSGAGGVLPSPLGAAAANATPQSPGGATAANGSASSFGAVTSAGSASGPAVAGASAGSSPMAAGSSGAQGHGGTASSGAPLSANEKSLPGAPGKPEAPAATGSSGGSASPQAAAAATAKAGATANSSNGAGGAMSWIQDHMLGVVTAVLALIVLIIAWILRRINTVRDDGGGGSQITEAMVQEKLDQINLDLRQPPDDVPTVVKD